jgi:CheY-like chemotaxis protein
MQPAGGVFSLKTSNVTLKATSVRAAGDYLCLTVKDTGSGMLPGVLAHVFEPFFTTKPPGSGTGLGLAQVWGFARQSGGDVTIESVPGQGAAFFFHLPRPTAGALEAAAVSRPKVAAVENQRDQAAGRTVLVVEGNHDLASLTLSILEGQGYATLYAANAADALALLDAGATVDAVFSDVVMPGSMNGVELATTLRQLYPGIAVTLATGYSEFLTQHRGSAVAEVLSKPYHLNDLTAALGRAFAHIATTRGFSGRPV